MNVKVSSVSPATQREPGSVVERWRELYLQRVEAVSRLNDRRMLHRLQGFGTWPVILVDLILLLIIILILSFVLLFGAVGVIAVHDGAFTKGLTSSSMSAVLKSAADWLISPGGLAVGALITQLSIVAVLYWRLIAPRIMTWADIGYGPSLRDRPLRAFLYGLGVGVAAYAVGLIILTILQHFNVDINGQQNTLKSVKHSAIWVFIPFALTAAVTAPLAEEAFFRGYMLKAMSVRYGLPWGIGCSSVAFGALHLLGNVGYEAIALAAVGAVLGWGYSRTGNMITNVTAHMFNNVIGLILLYNM
ncbi:MAG: putative metal-dependent rane protease [Chloroflexi bacterium]|nr:putative metal-dependent rane protease [Chloroflexota bacterium]